VDITTTNPKPKSFWERPEGTTGMLTLALLGVGGFFLAKAILPTVLSVLDMAIGAVGKAITLGALGLVLATMIYLVTNKQVQTLVKYGFKNIMRAITGVVIEIDPIGIMKNYIDSLKEKKEKMDKNISALSGQIRQIKNRIDSNNQAYNNALNTAKVAKDKGMTAQFTLQARSAGRLQQSSMNLQQVLDKMSVLYRALQKYQEATAITIADLSEEVAVKSEERKAILAASSAMSGAMAILRGASPEKELFDQAMEFTVADYGQRLGEIEDFMSTTKSILEGIDLQNGVYDAEAMKKLEEWENKADSLVLGGDKRLLLEDLSTSTPTVFTPRTAVPVQPGASNDFGKFFN
jgi:hypothetical protein